MNRCLFPLVLCSGLMLPVFSGCDSEGAASVHLSGAGGVVTFNGKPLPDATVTFVPEKGPIASGVTDLSGKFTLSTGARPGAAVGNCQVTVSAQAAGAGAGVSAAEKMSAPLRGKEDGLARQKEMAEMSRKIAQGGSAAQEVLGSPNKSIIPEKYGKADTSQLSFKVEKDSTKNQFKIELVTE